ncbi:MAG: DUF4190 domain-containing protein [Flavobacteriia bacterium]|nr:DUF4190 domain-containing protein [Flavobacteriia bacterium]
MTSNSLKINLFFILSVVLFLQSCGITSRNYDGGYYYKKDKNKEIFTINNLSERSIDSNCASKESDKKNLECTTLLCFSPIEKEKIDSSSRIECDTICFLTNNRIIGKITEINDTIIKYQGCNETSNVEISIKRSEVKKIIFASGITKNYNEIADNGVVKVVKKKKISLAIASLFFGIFGMGFLGLVFGATQLSNIKKNPDIYGGREISIIGLIFSLAKLLIMLIVLFLIILL